MNEIFFLVDEAPEGGYAAKALGESIFTEADTLDELHANVRDAVRCHFEEGKAPKRRGSSPSSKGQSKSVL